jgi:arylsulfatase A-like enzyme
VASPDIFRTLVAVAGAEGPDHPIDGYDLMPFLRGEADESPRERYYYFLRGSLEAVREGPWKLRVAGDTTQLFNLQNDPGERFNRAGEFPGRVERMRARMKQFAAEVGAEVVE